MLQLCVLPFLVISAVNIASPFPSWRTSPSVLPPLPYKPCFRPRCSLPDHLPNLLYWSSRAWGCLSIAVPRAIRVGAQLRVDDSCGCCGGCLLHMRIGHKPIGEFGLCLVHTGPRAAVDRVDLKGRERARPGD